MMIEEKIMATLNRDGGIEQFDLNGVMTLEVSLNRDMEVKLKGLML